ncbi:hypothetical protein H6P81_006413 [Aristolochia fimbriata]|uniref:Integrase catalytic domain-containing protein n=1 Tax=Aristolochia fimbriata TaxID=158543 RepID=A0AAV7EY63_ARIFI|nr:hypothetical protein H6P81_006413 [Aristolochia fimbriata]
MKVDEWALLDRRVLAVVRMSLTQSVAFNVSKEKTVKDLLTALAGVYEKSSASNRLFLLRKLVYLRMSEGTPIADHLNDFNKLWAQIEAVDLKFDDDVKALMFMCSLPESWDTMITSISNATKEKLKFDEVLSAILNKEMMKRSMVSNTSSTSDTALSVDKGKGRDRGRNQSRGPNNRDRSKSKGKSKGKFKCWFCDKEGHVENWYIDSGASFLCTSHKEWFCDYIKGEFGHVIVGNGQKCKIEGRGISHLKMNDGGKLILKEVRHIPDLQKNLISVNKLDQEGYKITFENSSCKVSRGALNLIKGKAMGTLYPLCTKVDQIVSLAAEKDDKASLWHRRLDCVLGKQKQVSFNKDGREKKSNRLDLVHTDVWGPPQGKSFGGNLYFVIFIDDYSRKTWIYTLKEKSNVFTVFKYWLACVENETGSRLKCLLSDNGGKFCNKEFDSYCAKRGIRRIKTVPRTPQQNGVAERMNRTILERAKSMRIHLGSPLHLWGATVDTTVYLINRSPSSALDGRIPEEVWAGKNVDYSFLKIFGCIAYAHIDREVRKKLDPKSTKCVFLGYGGDEYGYRLWDFDNNKVFRCRNVVFNEEQMYKDRKEEKKIKPKEKEYIKRDDTDENIPQATNEQVVPSEGEQQIETEQENESQGEQSSIDDGESHEYSNAQTDFDDSEIPQEEIVTSGLRRSTRVRKPVQKLNLIVQHVLYTNAGELESYDEAMADEAHLKWELAMKDEMLSLEENQTWELVKMPAKKKVLQNKWIFRVNQEADGVQRYKARLVVKGFGQREGIDFHDIFAPVVKMTSIRTILSIVAVKGLYLEQLDIKTAFLHGDLEEEIYMRQPAGFEVTGKESWVCKLKRSLYGLKQAPRQWYLKFDRFMLDIGFARSNADHCVYLQRFNDGDYIILTLYVDDMLVAGDSNMKKIDDLKKRLANQFSMKDLGEAKQLLGMQITRDKKKKKLWLSQEGYVKKVLERFNMHESKAVTTTLGSQFKLSKEQGDKSDEEIAHMKTVPYASAIGSLMYAMVSTRPDIAHAVGVVSRFMKNPGKEHWEAVKWIFRYLKGTSDYCLCFGGNNIDVKGFVDSDHAGDRDNGRSTSGYVFTVGGTAVSWVSKLQKVVALSSTEAEYVAATEASKEYIWLKSLMNELGFDNADYRLYNDSQSAIHLAKNSAFYSRTKHIHLRYHFIRTLLEEGQLKLEKIDGKKNPADMLTKPVEGQKLSLCSTMMNLH